MILNSDSSPACQRPKRGRKKAVQKPPVLISFPETAEFIAREPDKTAAIYRHFDTLSNQSLLQLQSKVALLEEQLAIYDAEDLKSSRKGCQDSIDALRCSTSLRDFEKLGKLDSNPNKPEPVDSELPPQQKRWKLAREIQVALKEYSKSYSLDGKRDTKVFRETEEAVLLHSEILHLRRPADRTIKAFRNFFEDRYKQENDEGGRRQLRNAEGEIYKEDDLLSLYTPLDEDYVHKHIPRMDVHSK